MRQALAAGDFWYFSSLKSTYKRRWIPDYFDRLSTGEFGMKAELAHSLPFVGDSSNTACFQNEKFFTGSYILNHKVKWVNG